MSIQSIFWMPQRGFREYDKYGIPEEELYQLDGVMKEVHKNTIRLSKHPVEYGANIVDHAIKQPYVISVEGVVTNSPFITQLGNNLPGSATFFDGVSNVLTGARLQETYKGILTLQNKRKPMVLQTGLLTYENMVLTKVSTPHDKSNRLMLSLQFEEVIIADTSNGASGSYSPTTTVTPVDFTAVATTLVGLGIAGLTFTGVY